MTRSERGERDERGDYKPQDDTRPEVTPPGTRQELIPPSQNPIPLINVTLSPTDTRAVINWLITQLNTQEAGLPVTPFAG